MSDKLILFFNREYIAALISVGETNKYIIRTDVDDLIWLYFFNDPHQNIISFGYDNKRHYHNNEYNYYGGFIDKIESDIETVAIRGIERPLIDLLAESGVLKLIKDKYNEHVGDNHSIIRALIIFSPSINDSIRFKIIKYFNANNFVLKYSLLGLSQLACCFYFIHKSRFIFESGTIVVMEAFSSLLSIHKIDIIDNKVVLDEDFLPINFPEKGVDPRKKSIIKFVITEVNKATNSLYNFEREFSRFEESADKWLKRIDDLNDKRPILIKGVSLSSAPNIRRDIYVTKNDIDVDTGCYVNELADIYNTFRQDYIGKYDNVAAIVMIGDCFVNDYIRKKFETIISKNKLKIARNNCIYDFLSLLSILDLNRFTKSKDKKKSTKILSDEELFNKKSVSNDKDCVCNTVVDEINSSIHGPLDNHLSDEELFGTNYVVSDQNQSIIILSDENLFDKKSGSHKKNNKKHDLFF